MDIRQSIPIPLHARTANQVFKTDRKKLLLTDYRAVHFTGPPTGFISPLSTAHSDTEQSSVLTKKYLKQKVYIFLY